METTDTSILGFCSAPLRDRQNQRRVTIWSVIWGVSYIIVTIAIQKGWLSSAAAIAAVIGTSLFGVATLLAYHRFLRETDELRRKIEVDALALAFGIGLVGGLTFFLLFENSLVSGRSFGLVFVAMILAHTSSVVIGRRRYS
jgi:hypothetical protein